MPEFGSHKACSTASQGLQPIIEGDWDEIQQMSAAPSSHIQEVVMANKVQKVKQATAKEKAAAALGRFLQSIPTAIGPLQTL